MRHKQIVSCSQQIVYDLIGKLRCHGKFWCIVCVAVKKVIPRLLVQITVIQTCVELPWTSKPRIAIMGSSQSSRKLTISNEEGVGVIKLSNSIIQRLAQAETSTEPTSDAKPDVPSQQAPPPSVATAPRQAADIAPGQPVYYYPELTVSALKMQQQMENELKQQEQYWQRRLQKLESGYQKLNAVLEDEYKKATSETSATTNRQVINDVQGAVQPCIENSDKILKCLQDHPKETLKCSNLVEEFSNCIWNVQYTYMIKV